MKISEKNLRTLIREELENNIPRKPSTPIPLEELQFVPNRSGGMPLPGVGAYKIVSSPEELEDWKFEFIKEYGPTNISWDHNGWHVDNKAFRDATDRDRQTYLDYEKAYRQRHGRNPSLGT